MSTLINCFITCTRFAILMAVSCATWYCMFALFNMWIAYILGWFVTYKALHVTNNLLDRVEADITARIALQRKRRDVARRYDVRNARFIEIEIVA